MTHDEIYRITIADRKGLAHILENRFRQQIRTHGATRYLFRILHLIENLIKMLVRISQSQPDDLQQKCVRVRLRLASYIYDKYYGQHVQLRTTNLR